MNKIVILIGLIAIVLSCSKDSSDTQECDCTKTLYLYYPPMNSVGVHIKEHYDVVAVFEVKVDCEEETSDYVQDYHSNYTHYKINCDW